MEARVVDARGKKELERALTVEERLTGLPARPRWVLWVMVATPAT